MVHCSDAKPAPIYPARHDTPKSGSRREAIEALKVAAHFYISMVDAHSKPSPNTMHAALNYMIMHDGW